MAVDATAIVYEHVELGRDAEVGPFAVLGEPMTSRSLPLRIGEGAKVRSHSVIYAGSSFGVRLATGHGVLVREACTVGDDVSIGSHSVVEHDVTIEDGVRLHSQVFVPEFTRLLAGSWIGPNAVLTNARYPLSRNVKEELAGPVIGRGAIVGANATLLPGLVIGERAVVGAGAVVVRDVDPGAVVAGNPARVVGDISSLPYE
ncbi:MAG: DapH/DapD/GlmU-related protein [Acidimicrobiia bacterium]